MANKSFVIVSSVLVLFACVFLQYAETASTGSAAELKDYSKRSGNGSEIINVEEAAKTCNQSFSIKMGKKGLFY